MILIDRHGREHQMASVTQQTRMCIKCLARPATKYYGYVIVIVCEGLTQYPEDILAGWCTACAKKETGAGSEPPCGFRGHWKAIMGAEKIPPYKSRR